MKALTHSCRIRGRYPWFQESMLRRYGDVVRGGPNEVVFTPQAAMDTPDFMDFMKSPEDTPPANN